MNKKIPAPTLVDYLQALHRRRFPALVTSLLILIASLTAAFFWPATYHASGTILIEQQELPTDLVRSTISSYADQRIQIITQRVMTTENLFKIIQKYDLYERARKRKPREAIIQAMREKIDFEMISADVIDPRHGNPTKATIAFSVGFSDRSADLAARVANELVNLYLEENIESRKQSSANATTFLAAEAERLSARIAELGEQVARFKEANADDLPELMSLNLQLMNGAEAEIREIDTRTRSLDQQIVYLDAQLAQLSPVSQVYTSTGERVLSPSDRLKYLRTEFARARALYSADHPDVVRLAAEIAGMEKTVGTTTSFNDLERQLSEARNQLAAARERYGEGHPDIVTLGHLVSGLEGQLRAGERQDPSVSIAREEPDNPAYIQVKAQREASVSERDALVRKRAEMRARQRDFEARLAKTPAVEREYAALLRDLDGNQVKYQEVRQKQMEAQLAQNLEEGRKGERFTLIEPPLVPQEPASPNRIAILVLGVIFALGGAGGCVALLEVLDGRVRHKRDVVGLLDVAPLAVLPWIETSDERSMRSRVRRLSLAGGVATIVGAVTLAHFFYRPLDVLWAVAMRRLLG